jgi:hypothetical protein
MAPADRQHYIPVSRARVREDLFQLEGISDQQRESLSKVAGMLEAIWHHRAHAGLERLKLLYEKLDPDQFDEPELGGRDEFLSVLFETLGSGNWEEISDEEMQAAMEGESVFPISLDIRSDEFVAMHLFKLGELVVSDVRSSWFGLKKEEVEIDSYDRVILIIQFQEKEWFEERKRSKHYPGVEASGLHLRLFKTVPKLDLETIYPNTSPMMRVIDKVKIIAPLLGGFVTLGLKFGPLLVGADTGDTSLSVIAGLCTALGTYVLKTYMSYQKTKEKYQTQVSKDLYFKGQANNTAVLNLLVDLAEEQEVKEALLAYTFLLVESDKKYGRKTLDSRIEQWLTETFGYQIDFEIADALTKLQQMKLIREEADGLLSVPPTAEALTILDEQWDGIFNY